MKSVKRFMLVLCFVGAPMLASADPIRVAYQIGDYSAGGFSASALHTADGCRATGPTTGANLYMCGSRVIDDVTGMIYGILRDDGSLRIRRGFLNINGERHRIRGGGLDPSRELFGGLDLAGYGIFLFEHLNMGAGLPNSFNGDELILWGQNIRAYECDGSRSRACLRRGWGIDLYGKRVAVSEPGTLALFGLGLIALGASRRRKNALVSH
ncbi:MAG: PEP-CTERM sorting domain-containing protein [Pseudomonadota bacterium]